MVPLLLLLVLAVPAWPLHREGTLQRKPLPLPSVSAAGPRQFLFSVVEPSRLSAGARVGVRLEQQGRLLLAKQLHVGDPDLFGTVLPKPGIPLQVRVDSPALPVRYRLEWEPVPNGAAVEQEPNDRWEDATPIRLSETVFASADDVPYLPPSEGRPDVREQGVDWYRFDFAGPGPKLAYLWIDLVDRDGIPVDVSLHTVRDGALVPHVVGEDPVTPPHEVQALPGNKFTTRLLPQAGTYYVRVVARHPAYRLRTRLYDPPPYRDPRQAVRTALDYLLGAGDSWHANTPRRGGVFDRVASPHQETTLCVACHPTHFTQRAQLYALRQGYGVEMRPQLQFLAERFYNNPRPFYGFEREGAVWARVISAPANVLGRMSHLLDLYERQVTGERRDSFHRGVREYLRLYYQGRTALPPDETNGNTPLVSAYEVAWYAWEATRDPAVAALVVQDAPKDAAKNLIDLCYQTLALAAIDRQGNAAWIARNAQRILSFQRPSGQWAARFEPDQPEAEFQTGHALWALQAAGIPAGHPQVAKGLAYLLARQQPFGAWFDPQQSYENFKTPFRESQMAVLALSAYYPQEAARRAGTGWGLAPAAAASRLDQLEATWPGAPAPALVVARSGIAAPGVLTRLHAVEAVGRAALVSDLPLLLSRLQDPSKLVQRAAAWAVRQVYSRHPETATASLEAALSSRSERQRWGATRVFAHHFSALAQRPALAAALQRRLQDPLVTARLQAVKALWQFWFWSPDQKVNSAVEDAVLAALDRPQPAWVERALREAVYNLADENIRYLYNNWVPLLAEATHREQAIRGRLAVEDRLSSKFAAVLERGSDRQRKRLLTGLTTFWLRWGDVYDLSADPSQPAPPVYNRIGNDIEQVAFFGEANSRMARALEPLLDSADLELRELATQAVLLVRDARFATASAVAGEPGPERDRIVSRVLSRPVAPEFARAFAKPGAAQPAAAKPPVAAQVTLEVARPDRAYFDRHLRPIFEAKGKDGYACVQCHASHTRFSGSFESALTVIDRERPEESLLLRKPISTAESEGVVGARTTAHGGGVRFDRTSPEYNAILNWIRGAKP